MKFDLQVSGPAANSCQYLTVAGTALIRYISRKKKAPEAFSLSYEKSSHSSCFFILAPSRLADIKKGKGKQKKGEFFEKTMLQLILANVTGRDSSHVSYAS